MSFNVIFLKPGNEAWARIFVAITAVSVGHRQTRLSRCGVHKRSECIMSINGFPPRRDRAQIDHAA